MKIKSFLHILLFTVMFTLYSVMSWATVILFFWNWFIVPNFDLNTLNFLQSVGLSFISLIINPVNLLIFREQIKLGLNDGKQEYNNHRSLIYSGILFPWIVLIIGILFNFIIL